MTGPPLTGVPTPALGPPDAAGFEQLIERSRIIICAGPGGVGKTTVAAATALAAAAAGRRCCVVTIDPARRLADALGLGELSNDPRPVPLSSPGQLWALMLDTKTTFDDMVRRYARSREQAEAILANGVYRNLSGALGGTQEYMAVEKLWELAQDPRFDLVVVDTPPTRNALDFLDAPERLTRFLGNRVFRLMMMPTRAGLRAVNLATQLLVRSVSRVVGGEVVADVMAFFTAFEGMDQGFRQRASQMGALLRDPTAAFVVVAAPRRDAVAEAGYFIDQLRESGLTLRAVVVNRVTPRWGPMTALTAGEAGTGGTLGELLENLAELDDLARSEEHHIATLLERAPGALAVRVPYLDADVHDLAGLTRISGLLTTPVP